MFERKPRCDSALYGDGRAGEKIVDAFVGAQKTRSAEGAF
jgi:hypothetical protein